MNLDQLQKISVILIPLVGGAFTTVTYIDQRNRLAQDEHQHQDQLRQDRRRQSQEISVKILSEREAADAAMRAKIFETLVAQYQQYQGKVSSRAGEQIPLLEMLVLNFHDTLNVSPLLTDLAARLARENDQEGLVRLRAVGQKVARRQISQILAYNFAPDGGRRYPSYEEMQVRLRRRGPDACNEKDWDQSFEFNRQTQRQLCFRVVGRGRDWVEMQLLESGSPRATSFRLGYYDLPLIDNTSLPGLGRRLSFVLRDIDPANDVVSLGLLIFPEEITGSRDRPFVEGMVDQLQKLP